MIKPIETVYNGYRFRSRLEARWAVCFDELGIQYEYEKEGYELIDGLRYLPDFWLPIPEDVNTTGYPNAGHWVEVKAVPEKGDYTKLILLSIITKHNGVMVIGPPWEFSVFYTDRHGFNNSPWTYDTDDPDYDASRSLHMVFNLFIRQGGTMDALLAAKSARFEYQR